MSSQQRRAGATHGGPSRRYVADGLCTQVCESALIGDLGRQAGLRPYGALSALVVAVGNRALLVKPASSATAPDAPDLDSTVAQRTCFDGAPRSCHLGLVAVPVVTTAGVMYVTSEAEGRMG
jgi:hypothetical protein